MRNYINHITGQLISDADWEMLQAIIREERLPRGDLLLKEGQFCRKIWYLHEGAVRFYENVQGEYRSTHFFIAPAMFTVYESLINGSPSTLYIEAVEDLTMQALPYPELLKLYDNSHTWERVGRKMAEYNFSQEFHRRRMFLNMDALERYEYLEARQPEIFQRFQLKDIATFLGITPVSLSRLRKYRLERK